MINESEREPRENSLQFDLILPDAVTPLFAHFLGQLVERELFFPFVVRLSLFPLSVDRLVEPVFVRSDGQHFLLLSAIFDPLTRSAVEIPVMRASLTH